MNPPEDPIDALLREQNTYIEDNGFTARIMASIPQRHNHAWVRPTLLLAATMVGCVLAVFWLPWEDLVRLLTSLNTHSFLSCLVLFAVMGSLMWGAMAAIQNED